jgi:Uma2 family endonuclease
MLQTLETSQNIPADVIFPSNDLYSDEPTLETYLHLQQMILLIKCLDWLWRDKNDYFATGNLTIYYSPVQSKSSDFRGPDFFVVLNTERKARKSWVVWEENGKYPNVIIELLSESTANIDRTEKKRIYQDIFQTGNYFWFDPNSLELAGFRLTGQQYQPIEPTSQGWLWSHELELYLGVYERKLRFFTAEGRLVPTPEEAATSERLEKELAQQQAQRERLEKELAQQQAQRERQQAEKLAAKLRELGIDPDSL